MDYNVKINVFGSSHCKYLSGVDLSGFNDTSGSAIADYHYHTISGIKCRLEFFHYSGKSYEFFLAPGGAEEVRKVVANCPDYIIVLFGGNSISTTVSRAEVLKSCTEFYKMVYQEYMNVNPNGKIIASQLLMRYSRIPNDFNTPGPDEYKAFRNLINRKIYHLVKREFKHFMLIVAGPKLDQRQYFNRLGVHLKPKYYRKLYDLMLSSIGHALPERQ